MLTSPADIRVSRMGLLVTAPGQSANRDMFDHKCLMLESSKQSSTKRSTGEEKIHSGGNWHLLLSIPNPVAARESLLLCWVTYTPGRKTPSPLSLRPRTWGTTAPSGWYHYYQFD